MIKLPGMVEMSNYVSRGKRLTLAGARRAMRREMRHRAALANEQQKVRASSNLTRSELLDKEDGNDPVS